MESLKVPDGIMIGRLDGFLGRVMFPDVNLYGALYSEKIGIDRTHLDVGSHFIPDLKRVKFEEGIQGRFNPVKEGDTFGPTWSTHWFKVDIQLPQRFEGQRVVLIFHFEGESLVWSKDGRPFQGLYGHEAEEPRIEFPLPEDLTTEKVTFYIESACNTLFGAGGTSLIDAPTKNATFRLLEASLAVPKDDARALFYDIQILSGIVKDLGHDHPASAHALLAANRAVNIFRREDPSTWKAAACLTSKYIEKLSDFPIDQRVIASGHCHIDTAWLWPYAETKRKCARSWSSQIRLLEKYPWARFVCSQAQQMEWVMEDYPFLFQEIQTFVAAGKFIPIGGTWVEMDGNLPSGESFFRQFLYGQRFFEKHFGRRTNITWLPDTFGYAAQLPQILQTCGCPYFLSIKLSWNNFNKFPHSSFNWTSLDGTSVVAHFPPSGTYEARCRPSEITRTVKGNKDKTHAKVNSLLYGVGDGGGGPTEGMLQRLERLKTVPGTAHVSPGDPAVVFQHLESIKNHLSEWKGELYFELHRGTYTSHAWTKQNNRNLQRLLHDVEVIYSMHQAMSSAALTSHPFEYPSQELDDLWKTLLRNQFHDVLPGSSIHLVYEDSMAQFSGAIQKAKDMIERSLESLSNVLFTKSYLSVFNSTPFPRTEVVRSTKKPEMGQDWCHVFPNESGSVKEWCQISRIDEHVYWLIHSVPSFTLHPLTENSLISDANTYGTSVQQEKGCFLLKNRYIRAQIDQHGRIASLRSLSTNGDFSEEFMESVGNRFVYYEDVPLYWDAWDVQVYHLDKKWDAGLGNIEIDEPGPIFASIKLSAQISSTSSITQIISLPAESKTLNFETTFDWNEKHKLLKVLFPVNVHSDVSNAEVQYGHVQKPTHFNTSWDTARFEISAQRFVDLSEAGRGIALLNDCKHGFSVHQNVMAMSILRSPKKPDEQCDIGSHTLKYALYPHLSSFLDSDVAEQAIRFNHPLLVNERHSGSASSLSLKKGSFFSVTEFRSDRRCTLVLDNIKKREDDGRLVFRFYEAYGGRGIATLNCAFPIKSAWLSNGLEDEVQKALKVDQNISRDDHSIISTTHTETDVIIRYKPMQIISLIVEF